MREEARGHSRGIVPIAAAALGVALLLGAGTAQAGVKYLGDGAIQNARGGWDLPKQGACPADATAKTRPDCVARRFVAKDSAACTALGASGAYSWSTGVCNDLVNTTQTACQKADGPLLERRRERLRRRHAGRRPQRDQLRPARRHVGDDRGLHGRVGDAGPGRLGLRRGRAAHVQRRGRPVPALPQHRDAVQRASRPRHELHADAGPQEHGPARRQDLQAVGRASVLLHGQGDGHRRARVRRRGRDVGPDDLPRRRLREHHQLDQEHHHHHAPAPST